MPQRMFASDPHCITAEVERSGKVYRTGKNGTISVEDGGDVKALQAGGYVNAGPGGTPKVRKHFHCAPCGWDALINSCPKCGSTDLERVEK
jgi:hypothetical protein